jgi:hypothetical protein
MKIYIRKLWREPLVHFLLIGAALFLFYGLVDERGYEAQNRIVVNDVQVEQLTANFKRTWMRPPTEDELAALVENHVRDEVFYREALAMGLDQNDSVVRQRLRMKLEFILEDLSSKNASDEELAVYLKQHPDKFRTEAQLSFRQVFLDSGKRKDLAADAKILLAELNKGSAPESLGDSSMLPGEFSLASQSEIARSFGERFSAEVITLKPGDWTGPIYSPFGGHLLKISERVDAHLPELADIRGLVEREYFTQQAKEQKELVYQKLRQGYEVILEPAEDSVGAAIPSAEALVAQ